MLTNSPEGRQLANQLALQIVQQIKPEEAPIFQDLADEYYEEGHELPNLSETSEDDELAFGLDGAVISFSHAALAAANVILPFIVTELLKASTEDVGEHLRHKIRDLFRGKEADDPPPLAPEQLEQVKKMARKQARAFGLDAAQARILADALVGSLATL